MVIPSHLHHLYHLHHRTHQSSTSTFTGKSLHIYAPPFAQLVDSPNKINGVAMQVDTWHREKMNLTGSPFVPGPVPRHALAPTTGPDAIYSGLLECAFSGNSFLWVFLRFAATVLCILNARTKPADSPSTATITYIYSHLTQPLCIW